LGQWLTGFHLVSLLDVYLLDKSRHFRTHRFRIRQFNGPRALDLQIHRQATENSEDEQCRPPDKSEAAQTAMWLPIFLVQLQPLKERPERHDDPGEECREGKKTP